MSCCRTVILMFLMTLAATKVAAQSPGSELERRQAALEMRLQEVIELNLRMAASHEVRIKGLEAALETRQRQIDQLQGAIQLRHQSVRQNGVATPPRPRQLTQPELVKVAQLRRECIAMDQLTMQIRQGREEFEQRRNRHPAFVLRRAQQGVWPERLSVSMSEDEPGESLLVPVPFEAFYVPPGR